MKDLKFNGVLSGQETFWNFHLFGSMTPPGGSEAPPADSLSEVAAAGWAARVGLCMWPGYDET